MTQGSPWRIVPLLAATLLLAGCAGDAGMSTRTEYLNSIGKNIAKTFNPSIDNVSYWDGDEFKGPPSIVIHLDEQRAYFYKGKQLAGISEISTGREGLETPTGHFHIIQKDKDHVSSRYGNYLDKDGNIVKYQADRTVDPMPKGTTYDGDVMPYFMRIVGGTGMHEGYLPGYPASHGCIRMPGFMAENFFYNVEVGTPVTITK
ncbi:MAG TPA: L,D-transpeptidase family protein [Chthoniobacteraceae bacterium]|nr:L,D-transpeptidase family protein [Chthoniobacteraceae bacterium]